MFIQCTLITRRISAQIDATFCKKAMFNMIFKISEANGCLHMWVTMSNTYIHLQLIYCKPSKLGWCNMFLPLNIERRVSRFHTEESLDSNLSSNGIKSSPTSKSSSVSAKLSSSEENSRNYSLAINSVNINDFHN